MSHPRRKPVRNQGVAAACRKQTALSNRVYESEAAIDAKRDTSWQRLTPEHIQSVTAEPWLERELTGMRIRRIEDSSDRAWAVPHKRSSEPGKSGLPYLPVDASHHVATQGRL